MHSADLIFSACRPTGYMKLKDITFHSPLNE